MRLLGLDPGLRNTGWGVIEAQGNRLSYVADGVICSNAALGLAERLTQLFEGVREIVARFSPGETAIEEVFVNQNPTSTLKLGQARGAVMLPPALAGVPVFEYKPNQIKKSVVGVGHASKDQINLMVRTLLPGCLAASPDAADALAVAICHAHHRPSLQRGLA